MSGAIIDGYVNRFSVKSLTFHSYLYGHNLKCASYYALLASTKTFVEVKHIFVSGAVVNCVCRDYLKISLLSGQILSDDLLAVFDSLPLYFIMQIGGIYCYPASFFTHHAIIFKRESLFYGVGIQNNFEHE